MRLVPLRRTLIPVLAVMALAVGAIPWLAPAARAANTLHIAPTVSINNEVITMTITTPSIPFSPATDNVTLRSVAVSSDTIDGVVNPGTSSSTVLKVAFNLAAAAPTRYNVIVDHGGSPINDTCNGCFTVSSATPTFTDVSPSSLGQGTQATVTLTGSNLAREMTLGLPTGVTVQAGTLAVQSKTSATVDLNISGTAPTGTKDISFTNADGQHATCVGCLKINPPPTITSLSPNALGRGATHDVVVTGSGFQPGASVLFALGGGGLPTDVNGVTASNIRVNAGGTALTALVAVASNATISSRDMTITNPDGGTVVKTSALAVHDSPTVTAVTPTKGGQGTNQTYTVTGTNFVLTSPGPGTTFTVGGPDAFTVSAVNVTSSSSATVKIQVPATASSGARSITAVNPDFGSGNCASCWSVVAAPVVSSVTPSAVSAGTSSNLTVKGTGFASGATAAVGGTGVAVNSTTFDSDTQLTVNVTVAAGATQGYHTFTVTNSSANGGASGSCATCLFVNGLNVSSVSPVAIVNDGTKSLTVNGSGFDAGATVSAVANDSKIAPGAQDPITLGVDSGTSTSTVLHVQGDFTAVAPGLYDVTVHNPDGDAGIKVKGLTVTAVKPELTAFSPTRIAPGQTRTVSLVGTDFAHGMAVTESVNGISVVAGSVVVASPTSASVDLIAAPDAVVGASGSLTVTNTDNKTDSLAGMSVGASPAVVLSVPSSTLVGTTSSGSVNVTNPANGGTYDHGRVDFSLTMSGLALDDLTLKYESSPGTFTTIPLTAPGGGILMGSLPPLEGSPLAPGGSLGLHNLQFVLASDAPTGTLDVAAFFGDVVGTTRIDMVTNDFGAIDVEKLPGAPTNVTASNPGDQTADVSWTAPADAGSDPVTGYVVTPVPACLSCAGLTTSGATSTTVTGLANGTSYSFTVKATTDAGTGPASASSNAVTPATVPGAPTAVTATAGTGAATVGWTPPASTGGSPLTGYTVIPNPGCTTCGGLHPGAAATSTTVSGLTNGTAYTFTVVASNAVGNSAPSPASNAVTPLSGDTFQKLSPTRILDTRTTNPSKTIPVRGTLIMPIGGAFGVPADATAVALNVTAANETRNGYLTVYPTGTSRPTSSNLNFLAHRSTPGLVIARMGTDKKITIYNGSDGTVDVILDLFGFTSPSKAFSTYTPVSPSRVLDTRTSTGGHHAKANPNEDVLLNTTAPAGSTAVVLNLTVTGSTSSGFVTAYAADKSLPSVSNVNFATGQTVANLAVVPVDASGRVKLRNASTGTTHLIADLAGYYRPNVSGSAFHAQSPSRLLDTRTGSGTAVPSGSIREVTVAGAHGVPSTGASAVVVTLTAVGGSAGGFLTAYPSDVARPTASNVNYVKTTARANLAIVRLTAAGKIRVYNGGSGTVHVLVDESGYFTTH